jgi:hypothetical protein
MFAEKQIRLLNKEYVNQILDELIQFFREEDDDMGVPDLDDGETDYDPDDLATYGLSILESEALFSPGSISLQLKTSTIEKSKTLRQDLRECIAKNANSVLKQYLDTGFEVHVSVRRASKIEITVWLMPSVEQIIDLAEILVKKYNYRSITAFQGNGATLSDLINQCIIAILRDKKLVSFEDMAKRGLQIFIAASRLEKLKPWTERKTLQDPEGEQA